MTRDEKSDFAKGDDIPGTDQSSRSSQTQDQPAGVLPEQQKDLEQQPPPAPGPPAIAPPPNGGRVAWTQVLCGFCLFFNTFGILTSFGVFQTYYESTSSPFRRATSDISWIGSLQVFLLQFSGIIVGPIFDKGYIRLLLGLGGFLIVFGHMMLSIASAYWQILLAQGFCVGIGMGCLFVPSISLLPSYFSTRLGLAIGLASAGSSVGGVIYPVIMQQLVEKAGFPWAVRVLAFVSLVTLAVPFTLMRVRFKPAKARAMIDWTAFQDLPFLWFALATAIAFMGLTGYQILFAFYAKEQGITSTAFAFNLVSIYNAMSTVGRIVPNAISDKIGQFNVLAPAVLLTGAVYLCTMATHTQGVMIGITLLAGFFLGVLTAMPPVCLAVLTKDKSKIGTRIGTGFAIISLGTLTGGPASGAIVQRSHPLAWTAVWSFTGACMLVAGSMYAALRVARSGWKPLVKA
ncbi:monocarboxylate permease [Pochonia chlamydosporia 170]|uniref:Monocarboxylate permease n=1 Tax=Pochonia chlamydosporia 170 TaxID=1380566 RepID=A0A179FP89_METCM|nr:monocarboxylate permease [Pochonia chlamydosporia 170]OAQ66819.1 monocarboxylate permease [Pochonia chlamydosporia 170]